MSSHLSRLLYYGGFFLAILAILCGSSFWYFHLILLIVLIPALSVGVVWYILAFKGNSHARGVRLNKLFMEKVIRYVAVAVVGVAICVFIIPLEYDLVGAAGGNTRLVTGEVIEAHNPFWGAFIIEYVDISHSDNSSERMVNLLSREPLRIGETYDLNVSNGSIALILKANPKK